jgi:hypothetical protein
MRGLISLSLVGLAGCYTYQPIEPAAAPLGVEVRARINGAASDRVAPLVGSFDNRVLVGNVVENTNGVMTLEVPTGAMSNVAESVVRLHARVPIMPNDLVGLDRRMLDKRRTILFSGAVAGGVGLGVALALRSAADPQPGNLPNEPPPVARIPIWGFRF